MPALTPAEFVDKWERAELKERASTQEHFLDVCRLVEHPTPAEQDPTGENFTFEYGLKKLGGEQGYADVFYRGHFAIEYKGKGKYKTLDEAYRQLQQYRENLDNPPLLIVCDIEHWEIHTNWPNTAKKVYRFTNKDLLKPYHQRVIHALFFEPNALHPNRTTEQVTADAADGFRQIAENMRGWQAAPGRIAHFLTKLVFCLFAEDVGLLPPVESGKGIFSEVIAQSRQRPPILTRYLGELFAAMKDGGEMLFKDIPYFDGGLFEDVAVEDLSLEALTALERACNVDWSAVQPAIFGTLFERSLDPAKRAQLGAHYTSEDDIRLIVEPVLMAPLRREWDTIRAEAAPLREAYAAAVRDKNKRLQQNRLDDLKALRERMLGRLRSIQVLDPACGSGNFLYVSLNLLLDLEKAVITDPLWEGLPLAFPEVHPRQLHGIEVNEIAHDLASIVVWIGYIQWRQNNGYLSFGNPILEPLDNIQQMDAILGVREDGTLYDPEWPAVDVIVSNPPFLGGKKLRGELGDQYVDRLYKLWPQMHGEADLVTYWFEKARLQLEVNKVRRVGLLATNSIRGGANREVLERIKHVGDIFMAWSDREWILEGAAVRVSMVGFDDGNETERSLDGKPVSTVNSDLTSSIDITKALRLRENAELAYMGITPTGRFVLSGYEARAMLNVPNKNPSRNNKDVLFPYLNGQGITRRSDERWIVDFTGLPLEEASEYELPMSYVRENVKPFRDQHKTQNLRDSWWLFEAERPGMREGLSRLTRYIATPRVAKHRLFVWLNTDTLPDCQLIVAVREDDYFFGVLHSRLHEVWALRMGTWLGKGNDPRYTPTTTFETFPFPWPPGQEETAHPAYAAISAAAKQLHAEREAWLNPPGVSGKALERRTLTALYNALNVWRGVEAIKVPVEAADFAPRLDELHAALDRAVCDAYGWPHDILADEEEILRRLLALNLERA